MYFEWDVVGLNIDRNYTLDREEVQKLLNFLTVPPPAPKAPKAPKALPDRPSALLKLAVEDMQKVLARPGYRFRGATWFQKDFKGGCTVCMAGAVMAGTLAVPAPAKPGEELSPGSLADGRLEGPERKKLAALERARSGRVLDYIQNGFPDLYAALTVDQAKAAAVATAIIMPGYDRVGGRAGDGDYLAAADVLEGVGL